MILKHIFTPLNNTRLSHLCGPTDEHLRTIERELEVQNCPPARAVQGGRRQSQSPARHGDAASPVRDCRPPDCRLHGAAHAQRRRRYGREDGPSLSTRRADLKPRSQNQALYLDNIAEFDITFGIGPAGTGKTYLAVAAAVDALQRSAVQRIVLTRPAVEAGERLGFLPGDLNQKVDPYLRPLYDALYDLMGYDQVHKAFERQQLEIAPLAFMRGRTLNNAFVILDEAQNTTPEQMKMFLTRVGFGTKTVITGDLTQIDLPKAQMSGLVEAERVLRRTPGIAITRLTSSDIVRHPLVARIVDAYEAARLEDLPQIAIPDAEAGTAPRGPAQNPQSPKTT